MTEKEWIGLIINAAIAFGTLVVAFAAFFQDKIRGWLLHPKLDVELNWTLPDCHKTPSYIIEKETRNIIFTTDSYYFRLRVKNGGKQRAELVEVYATELLRKQADGTYERIPDFPCVDLVWSTVDKTIIDGISRELPKLCNIGHIIRPSDRSVFGPAEDDPGMPSGQTVFSIDVDRAVKKPGFTHLLAPGEYRLKLLIGAANANPRRITLEINLYGKWFDDENEMLSQGIGMKIIEKG